MKNQSTFTEILEMKVEAIKHHDIKGKESYYLKITDANGVQVFINVGRKNYEAVKNMKQTANSLT